LGKVPDEAAAYGIEDIGEDNRYVVRFLDKRGDNGSGACDNNLAFDCYKLLRSGLDAIGLAARPGLLDLQIAALDPP
jgi:hypothetical protein